MKESLDLKNLASPLYSREARFLKKDWVIKKKYLEKIQADRMKCLETIRPHVSKAYVNLYNNEI